MSEIITVMNVNAYVNLIYSGHALSLRSRP